MATSDDYTFFIGDISAYRVANGTIDAERLNDLESVGGGVAANADVVLFVRDGGTLGRCDGQGENCSIVTIASGLSGADSVTIAADGTVYVLVSNTIYLSTDNGATFAVATVVDESYRSLYFNPSDSNHVVVETDAGFYYSITGVSSITTELCTDCSGAVVFEPGATGST